jgi:hypothetical protein
LEFHQRKTWNIWQLHFVDSITAVGWNTNKLDFFQVETENFSQFSPARMDEKKGWQNQIWICLEKCVLARFAFGETFPLSTRETTSKLWWIQMKNRARKFPLKFFFRCCSSKRQQNETRTSQENLRQTFLFSHTSHLKL